MSGYAQGDLTSLNGQFKTVYGDYEEMVPENAYLMKEVGFSSAERIGENYVHGVELTRSHGWTMAVSTATPNLNAPVSRESKKATVDGYQSIMRSRISYVAANRAKQGQAAFVTETQATVEELRTSHLERLEVLALYGQVGLGTVSSVATDTVTLTQGSFAEGIWAGAENMKIDVYASNLTTFRGTKQIQSVDFDNRALTLNTGEGSGISANDVIFYQGGSTTTEYAGIQKITSNTGTLFGISAVTYNLWKSPTSTLWSVPLTLKDILAIDGRSRARGGKGDKVVLVHHSTFVDLVNDIEAARTFGGDQYKSNMVERGTQSLKLFSPTGVMTIIVHDCVKRGDAFGLNLSKWKRIGSTDPTFKFNGQDQYFFDLENVGALEIRSFADNAWFCTRPATAWYITGIQPTV